LKCNAHGFVPEKIEHKIDIPRGMQNNDILKLEKLGNQDILNSNFGNLLIKILINEHEFYKLDNVGNILVEIPIPIFTAITGGKIKVPTLHGIKEIEISEKTEHGHQFSLKGKGYYRNKNSFGDMYVFVKLEMPSNMDKEILEKIKNLTKEEEFPYYNRVIREYGGNNK
jgi:molecular chaperone DnaJ